MARAAPRRPPQFGPAALATGLRALLPGFPARPLCVAFSGGADSTALLAALAHGPRRAALRAVHIDHGLNPAARRWARHCRLIAARLRVPLTVRRVAVPKRRGASREALAREARYAALAAELRDGEALLTAHQEDDQLETLLLQLLRGAGVAGLAGMPACAPFAGSWLVRPLLGTSGAALRAYLAAQGLPWVEDDSNRDESFDRNYLRTRVLPLIRARWPAAAATASRAAAHLAEAQGLLDALGSADAARAQVGAALSARTLRALAPARRHNALRYWIARAGVPVPSARQLAEIAGPLLAARADTHPQVRCGTYLVQREAQLLWLRPAPAAARARRPPAAPLRWSWQRQPQLQLPHGGRLVLRADPRGPLDLGTLPAVLTLRARSGGERLRLRPGGPSRTLKGLLQEARVALQERGSLPLIFRGEQLVAVADRWFDAAIQAGSGTRRRGRLLYHAH